VSVKSLQASATCVGFLDKLGDRGPSFLQTCEADLSHLPHLSLTRSAGKRRWFVLTADRKLHYAYAESDAAPIDHIDLATASSAKGTLPRLCVCFVC
jgi:hypothetical protein